MPSPEVPAWFYAQSAVIPYRFVDQRLEVLLVTTRKGRWILPKGVIEPQLSAAESAAKEAREEGGVAGVVETPAIGEYTYNKWEGTCQVQVFLMQVRQELETWEDQSFRRRRWLPLEEALAAITEESVRAIVAQVPGVLASRNG